MHEIEILEFSKEAMRKPEKKQQQKTPGQIGKQTTDSAVPLEYRKIIDDLNDQSIKILRCILLYKSAQVDEIAKYVDMNEIHTKIYLKTLMFMRMVDKEEQKGKLYFKYSGRIPEEIINQLFRKQQQKRK